PKSRKSPGRITSACWWSGRARKLSAVPAKPESDAVMAKIISVHSYRGGTGKSNVIANLATALAARGGRVGVVDTDIQSPGIHLLFGLRDTEGLRTLTDYLWERCTIGEAATDVTPASIGGRGRVWLVPSSLRASDISK